jgi:hypothetical protein
VGLPAGATERRSVARSEVAATTAAATTSPAATATTATATVASHFCKTRVNVLLGLSQHRNEVTSLLGI